MTMLDGFKPTGSFKDEFQQDLGYQHMLPHHAPPKQRRPEMRHKPIEDYQYFAALVVLEDGSVHLRSSRDLKPYKGVILEDAVMKFNYIMSDYIGAPELAKPHRAHDPSQISQVPRDQILIPYSRKPGKRRHQDLFPVPEQGCFLRSERKVQRREPAQAERQVQIRVDDHEAQEKWFSDAFKAVQQVGCRTIAKVWIKKIHPKKQSTHPYNGGFPKHERADPNRTRPSYWPQHVIHREPDHIDRNARTALLVHLIMNTPQLQIKSPPDNDIVITARDLWAALDEKRQEFKSDRWAIISEIVNAREQIEVFEGGGIDADAVIHVSDFSESARTARGDIECDGEDADRDSGAVEDVNQDQDTETTPTSFGVQTPTDLIASVLAHSDHSEPNSDGEGQPEHRDQAVQQIHTEARSVDMTESEQPTPSLAEDTHSIAHDQKTSAHDKSLHRAQMQHELHCLQTQDRRQQEDILMSHWMPPDYSPYPLPSGYPMEAPDPPMATQDQSYRMTDPLMQHHRPDMSMNIPHGLPIFDTYDFTPGPPHSRPLLVRATSMQNHPSHLSRGLHAMPQAFFPS